MGTGRGYALALAVLVGCEFDTSGAGSGNDAAGTTTDTTDATGQSVSTAPVEVTTTPATATSPSTQSTTTGDAEGTDSTATTPTTEDTMVATETGEGVWSGSAVLTISAIALELSGPVERVPVLVRLNNQRIDYDALQAGAEDLRFIDTATSVQLPHEIERWTAGGNSTVWVLVPAVEPDVARTLTMEFGNPQAPDQQDPAGVWADEFVAVWHMDDGCDGDGDFDVLDSTGNGRHGTCVGLQSANIGAGLVGDAVQYENVAQMIEVPDDAAFDFQAEFTLEAWVLIEQPVLDGDPFDRAAIDRLESFRLMVGRAGGNNGVRFETWFDDGTVALETNPLTADWHYYVGASVEGTDQQTCLLLDGEPTSCRMARANLAAADAPLQIGTGMIGSIDEVRISAVRRSEDWVKLQFASITDALITY